jgi:hypothetical protein
VATLLITLRHPVMMLRHHRKLGSWPNAGRPRGLTEKLMWRKLFDRNPLFVTITDKLAARAFIAERSPALPHTQLLWSGDSAHDIPDEVMAGPTMVKPNNGSGVNFIVENGRPDRPTIARATRHLVGPAGNRRREEWAYWPIRGRLLAEKVVALGGPHLPTDLKVYVAGERVCAVWASDEPGDIFITLDADGAVLADPDSKATLPWSEQLAGLVREAARLALPLAAGFDMLRVDFLVAANGLLAGELTVYTAGGFEQWENPAIAEDIAGAWDLRSSWFLRQPHRGTMRLYAEALIAAETERLGLLGHNRSCG